MVLTALMKRLPPGTNLVALLSKCMSEVVAPSLPRDVAFIESTPQEMASRQACEKALARRDPAPVSVEMAEVWP